VRRIEAGELVVVGQNKFTETEESPLTADGESGILVVDHAVEDEQIEDLRKTIDASNAELVLIGTPIDLRKLVDFDRPALRVTYRLQEVGEPTLADVLAEKGLLAPVPV